MSLVLHKGISSCYVIGRVFSEFIKGPFRSSRLLRGCWPCRFANNELCGEDEGRDLFGTVYQVDEALHRSASQRFTVLAYGCELGSRVLA